MHIIMTVLIILVFVLLCFAPLIYTRIEEAVSRKKFNKLELNSKWVRQTDYTNPFSNKTIRITNKQIGKDGKTPWVMYEYQSGEKNTMEFKNFLTIYKPINE